MKTLTTTVLLLVVILTASAQTPEPKTIFKDSKITNLGLNFTGGVSVSQFYDRPAIFTNLGFGVLFNTRFRTGIDVEILSSNVDVANNALILPYSRMRWKYSSFGLNMDYTIMPNKIVSINPGLVVGMGMLSKHPLDGVNMNNDGLIDDSNMFVMRPNLSINFNLFKFMAFKLGGGYRFATGSKSIGISDSQISVPYGFATLRFEFAGPLD